MTENSLRRRLFPLELEVFLVLHFFCSVFCSFSLFCLFSANGRNVFCNGKRFCIALVFQIRLLKSPLTALIVTDFFADSPPRCACTKKAH